MSKEFVKTQINGYDLTIETGEIVKQAAGAVMVTIGETQTLVTACASRNARPEFGYFPLTVEYRPKSYAAGRIPGGFFKREGRPYDAHTLIARLIDRPIRPRFPKDFMNEVQIWATPVSFDGENDPDVFGIIGASAALCISEIPFDGPIAAVRVGYIGGEFIAFPTYAQREESTMDIVVAGTAEDIIMVEGGAFEIGEDLLLDALDFAKPFLGKLCELQQELIDRVGKDKMDYSPVEPIDEALVSAVREKVEGSIRDVFAVEGKKAREKAMDALVEWVVAELEDEFADSVGKIQEVIHEVEREKMREMILNEGVRIDKRKPDEIRPISIETSYLLRTHGSALFTRGETQALAVLTLGNKMDEQKIEDLEGESFKSFILHYNFPPFSVGEVKMARGPSRREIGHGNLAERALSPIIPSEDMFPYTVRIVSDVLESNGSSSMASVCAGSLSLMDAGVPTKAAVAGIAMGLVADGDKLVVLSDILGAEDHMGDMDFKVAGTIEGITAIQMDIKTNGISVEIMRTALEQAKKGREHILGVMNQTLDKPRDEISPYAPRIVSIKIDPSKIGAVIGTGGKTIRSIQDATGTTISIENDGTVQIASVDATGLENALRMVEQLTQEAKVGDIYDGKVVRITDFGAFVEIFPNQDGLLHISEIAYERTNNVSDVLNVGDIVKVKVLEIQNDGKIRLSRKALLEKPEGYVETERRIPRSDSRDRDNRNRGNRR
jgi:polyribonucleotide nucleotidyltransferase